jgi:hypothetical protein
MNQSLVPKFTATLVAITACFLTSCSTQSTFNKVPSTGRFSGEPRMVAIAPNTFFFFQPRQDQRFAFTTHKRDPALSSERGRGSYRKAEWRIEPGEMITTGASVPRNLWYVPGFSAFDYTRAALIHDWLYEAHHRHARAKIGYEIARKKNDRNAMARNLGDMKAYEDYANITQDDAADIFAECIKIAMIQSEEILSLFANNPAPLKNADLSDLKQALRYNRKNPRTLWAYHYFVSEDCFVKTSKRVWDNNNSDIEIYKVLASDEVAQMAREKGYLSPWLIGRFERILEREEQKRQDYQRAPALLITNVEVPNAAETQQPPAGQ